MKRTLLLSALVALAARAQTDPTFQPRRMSRWDPAAKEGRCILRVWIDDETDVELSAATVRLRTIAGQPGRDDGSECSQPMPGEGIRDFRFRGIDGRGEVRLVQEPRPQNGYTAVVSIRDKKGGGEGYTFELSWKSQFGSRDPGALPGWESPGREERERPDRGERARSGAANETQRLINACQDEIRIRLNRDTGSSVAFLGTPADSPASGSEMRLEGRAEASASRRAFRYSCVVNTRDFRVRQAEYQYESGGISGGLAGDGASSGASASVPLCVDAVRRRIERDFNRRVQVDISARSARTRSSGSEEDVQGEGRLRRENADWERFLYSCRVNVRDGFVTHGPTYRIQ